MTSLSELAEEPSSKSPWVANKPLLVKTTRPKTLSAKIQHGLNAAQRPTSIFTRCVDSAVRRIIVLKTGTQFPEKTGDMLKPVMLKTVIKTLYLFFNKNYRKDKLKLAARLSFAQFYFEVKCRALYLCQNVKFVIDILNKIYMNNEV